MIIGILIFRPLKGGGSRVYIQGMGFGFAGRCLGIGFRVLEFRVWSWG